MKVLIVKMSSLGDILHTLPALTDAGKAIPDIRFDWVVEAGFAELPAWHPLVDRVIPVAFRRLRQTPLRSLFSREWRRFRRALKQESYDLIIDAQGLIKSALIARMARGVTAGLDRNSARESLARLAYQKSYAVDPNQHAVVRVRQLFAQALGYLYSDTPPDYALDRKYFKQSCSISGRYVVFLHGTTWETKLWPEHYWVVLAKQAANAGYQVYLPWGNKTEHKRALRIVDACESEHVQVLPKMNLTNMAEALAAAVAVVAVDTGLGHVSAALGVPTVSLYGPTDPDKTGTRGNNQRHLKADFECAPCLQKECTYKGPTDSQPACFTTVAPRRVWDSLKQILSI